MPKKGMRRPDTSEPNTIERKKQKKSDNANTPAKQKPAKSGKK